jgi:hypothetical protein
LRHRPSEEAKAWCARSYGHGPRTCDGASGGFEADWALLPQEHHLIDDESRVWVMENTAPPNHLPKTSHVYWWYLGTDPEGPHTREHRTPAVTGVVVVDGASHVALGGRTFIDQSWDGGRTWKASTMDSRWRDIVDWFTSGSGKLFGSPRRTAPSSENGPVLVRSRDESWTSFDAVPVPAGFVRVHAAGRLLWSVRYEELGWNVPLPAEGGDLRRQR